MSDNRCDTCGKFRPWTDLKRVGYTPDSHRSSEDVERICSRCQCREREEQSAAQEAPPMPTRPTLIDRIPQPYCPDDDTPLVAHWSGFRCCPHCGLVYDVADTDSNAALAKGEAT